MSETLRAHIRSMINNLINDKSAEADMDIHNYLVPKMKAVAGIGPVEVTPEVTPDASGEGEVPAGDEPVTSAE
jgi:hypothetical protein